MRLASNVAPEDTNNVGTETLNAAVVLVARGHQARPVSRPSRHIACALKFDYRRIRMMGY